MGTATPDPPIFTVALSSIMSIDGKILIASGVPLAVQVSLLATMAWLLRRTSRACLSTVMHIRSKEFVLDFTAP